MNFFAEQDKAKRNTWLLIALMTAAVCCLIVVTILAVSALFYFTTQNLDSVSMSQSINTPLADHARFLVSSDLMLWIAVGVIALVTGGSLFKLVQLGGNGKSVATALGGKQIQPNTQDRDEKKILNVVEEMAIASGNPVPAVYLLEEQGINAFAAGTDRRNAVIGVTRGCVQTLSREELQGVIAHEFSHIHFGDMRINLRLVAIIHGILLIGLTGSYLLRSSAYRHRRKNQGGQVGLGLLLFVLGYLGVFFGNIIKSAVSRQREYLADASAVQFTRNPEGIANALKKIGGHASGSMLTTPKASEFSHFYFGAGLASRFGGWFNTHPPLNDRIKRIEPRWNGQYLATGDTPAAEMQTAASGASAFVNTASIAGADAKIQSETVAQNLDPLDIQQADEIGQISAEKIEQAKELLHTLPNALYDAAHEPFMARAVIYCLLIDQKHKDVEKKQIDYLCTRAHPATYKTFLSLYPTVRALPQARNLPLLELCIPALKLQSQPQYQLFKQNMMALIKQDKHVSLFEWCMFRSVTYCCEEKSLSGNKKLTALQHAISVVVAATCEAGEVADNHAIFKTAESKLPGVKLAYVSPSDVGFKEIDKALSLLSRLRPMEKPKFLKAIAACIQSDNIVTDSEAELYRAICDTLNCPAPLIQ